MHQPKDDIPATVAYSGLPPRPSRLRRVSRLARKELREILRDRRTIVTLIAMPLLLYPLMSVTFQQFYFASRVTPETGQEYRISALTSDESRVFDRRFNEGQKILLRRKKSIEAPPARGKRRTNSQIIWYLDPKKPKTDEERAEALERLKQKLRSGEIDLIIAIPGADTADVVKTAAPKDHLLKCEIIYSPNTPIALAALSYIKTVFAAVNEKNLEARLNLPDASPRITLLNLQPMPLEGIGPGGVISLSALVPLVLILMTITGAVYPAIDLTAGERERGTLEILVAAPVSRWELLSAKYIAVVTVAVLNALVNVVCMAITLSWSGLGSALIQGGGLSVVLLLQVFALLLLFAAFFSAVLLCLTSFARSFKEAQAYLIPLMLASLAPGIMAMMPGLKLKGILVLLPLVNIVLLARDLFNDDVDPIIACIVILMTAGYALAALGLAARVFGAEAVLYSEQSTWTDMLRRPDEPQPALTLPMALWCLGLMVPIQFGLQALLRTIQAVQPIPIVVAVFLSVGINLLLFGLLPAVFVWLGRVKIRSGLGLHRASPPTIAAGLLLGGSLWPMELYLLAQSGLSENLQERLTAVLQSLHEAQASLGWGVIVVVVVPAVLEEFSFRGLLFQALARRSGPALTIGASGLLFGVTHVVLDGALGLERLVPSTLLGWILGAVCWRTGSLLPCVLLHVGHNVILLSVGLNAPNSTPEIPWQWLLGGAAGALVGSVLLWRSGGGPAKQSHDGFH